MSVFNAQQLEVLAYMPLELQVIGFDLSLVFFGFYCLSIGYLAFRSTFLPRILGVLRAIGGLCYVTNSFADFLAPELAAHLFPYVQLPSLIGEGSLCLWLITIGVDVQRWMETASVPSEGLVQRHYIGGPPDNGQLLRYRMIASLILFKHGEFN